MKLKGRPAIVTGFGGGFGEGIAKHFAELGAKVLVSKACDILDDHISRTKHFHARVNWSTGRSHRKDYKFRDYSAIFAD